ncbi:MAG: hypothetical protein S4CHLAM107_11680 [Chlamydiia bacterium]|nr:hypothetical protein [Chlamydiia bacterium]
MTKAEYQSEYGFEMSQIQQYLMALKQSGGVTRDNYALVVITIMTVVGMDRIQNIITEISKLQEWVSKNQTMASEIQNFINKLLGETQTNTPAGSKTPAGGLPPGFFPQPGKTPTAAQKQHEQQLTSFIKQLMKQFFGGGSGNETWQDLKIDGIPVFVNGKLNPKVAPFINEVRKYVTGSDGPLPAGSGDQEAPAYIIMAVMAFNAKTPVYNKDGSINFQKTFGPLSGNAGLTGLKNIFQELNQSVDDQGSPPKSHNLWDLIKQVEAGDAGALATLEQCFMTMGKNYWNSKNGTPPGPASILEQVANAAGQAQTYLQAQTQTNTALIQQDIQTLESYDKIGQSMVKSSTDGTSDMVNNQIPK